MYLIGYDIGTSSVKASLVDVETGECIAKSRHPQTEASIISIQPGWAEQEPEAWWDSLCMATKEMICAAKEVRRGDTLKAAAIGISYQMHGLVCIDKNRKVLRPAILWCDSRSIGYGEKAFHGLGEDLCLGHLLNSPGNFTAAKLAWVKDNEPDIYDKIDKVLLPGDYIAMRMTGNVNSTVCGLSEGMFWDFCENRPARFLLDWFGFDEKLLPEVVPTFSVQGTLTSEAARQMGLSAGIPISYRAGDQPNNALSLNVFEPGEIAATAGTSGVVYGITGKASRDPLSRINTFAHVNHTSRLTRLGMLLCINSVGILNSWARHNMMPGGMSYEDLDDAASEIPIGCDGVCVIPFGNGTERLLRDKTASCKVSGINFNRHDWRHLARAAQEGVAFSFRYGMDIMKQLGMEISTIRAGTANLFLSQVFREALAGATGSTIEFYDTDGATGAAKGAGIGAGIYTSTCEAFSTLKAAGRTEPARMAEYEAAYQRWLGELESAMQSVDDK